MTTYRSLFHVSTVDEMWAGTYALPAHMRILAVERYGERFRMLEIEDSRAPSDVDGQRIDLMWTIGPDDAVSVRYGRRPQ